MCKKAKINKKRHKINKIKVTNNPTSWYQKFENIVSVYLFRKPNESIIIDKYYFYFILILFKVFMLSLFTVNN